MTVKFRLILAVVAIMMGGTACSFETNPLAGLVTDSTTEALESGSASDAAGSSEPIALGPTSASSGLDRLDSYRANLILDFEGTLGGESSAGHLESLTEVNRPAQALHRYLNAEADIPNSQLADGVSEFFSIDGNIYISRAGEILHFENEAEGRALPDDLGFFDLERLIVLPAAVREQPQLENLNGQHVLRYSFDQDDLASSDIVFEQATGNAWVNATGDYLVQYVISATIKALTPIPNAQLMDEGKLAIQYKVTDVDASIPINLPKRANAIQAPFADFPAPPQSELTAVYPTFIEYTSVISPISATLFYQTGLSATGWTEESSDIFNEKSRLTFSKDDQLLTVIITPAGESDEIKIVLDVVTQR